MRAPDTFPHGQRRTEERRSPEPTRLPDTSQRERTLTRFVDPYDMRAEPQPEEPGYGHGV